MYMLYISQMEITRRFHWCFSRYVFSLSCVMLLFMVIAASYFNDVSNLLHPIYSSSPGIHGNSPQAEHDQDESQRRKNNGAFHQWDDRRQYVSISSNEENTGPQAMVKQDQPDTAEHHVAFLKVHKAASTTVQNIFYRYGYQNDLAIAQPVYSTFLKWNASVKRESFLPPPRGKTKFDIMCVHATYNRKAFEMLLPKDSMYIGIVREPFKQFASSLNYFHWKEIIKIPGANPVRTFLSDSLHKQRFMSTLDPSVFNTQSRDLGFPVELLNTSEYDEDRFRNFLQQLDRELDLVLLVERFDESMVLMRRLLKWEIKDVISGKLNSKTIHPRFQFGATEEMLLKNVSFHDYVLYDFFKKKFQAKVDEQPPDFNDELVYFKQIKIKYNKFCLSVLQYNYDASKVLPFEGSAWNKPFKVTWKDCKLLYMKEINFSHLIKTKLGFPIHKKK